MNYSNHRLTFDIHDILSNTVVKVKRGDNTHRLCISLTENGKVYQIADSCTAVFKGKKPDGFSLYNDCTIEDNCIYYVMGNNTTSALGVVSSEVSLISGDREVITSPTFSILVEDTTIHDDDVYDSSDEVTALVELVAETTALKEEVEEVLDRAVIDHELKSDSSNPVANYVIKNELDYHMGAINSIAQMIPKVDDHLDYSSTNPIQNKVVAERLSALADEIPKVDSALAINSTNPVQNKVVSTELSKVGNSLYQYGERISTLEENVDSITVDDYLDYDSTNAVQNQAVTKKFVAISNQMFGTGGLNERISALEESGGSIDTSEFVTNDQFDSTVGNMEAALDSIIAIQNSLMRITFTVNGAEYQADAGMTWADLCNSEYNPSSNNGPHVMFYEDSKDGNVYYFLNSVTDFVALDGVKVKATDVIIPNCEYDVVK